MSPKSIKHILLSVALAPLILIASIKTLMRIRNDIKFPNPDMWE